MINTLRTVTAGIFISAVMLCLGCGSKDDKGEQKVVFAEDQYATQHPPSIPAGPTAVVVTIADMKFQPADVTVRKGDTIVFNNKDMVTHDITDEKTKKTMSGPLAADGSWRFVPTESGNYYCSLHPVMKGTITIR